MTSPISNLTWVWLRGRYVDLVKAQRGSTQFGVVGKQLTATPKLTPPVLRNPGLLQHIGAGSAFKATPNAGDGTTILQVPASDDPDILVPGMPAEGFAYTISDPLGQTFDMYAPADTPIVSDGADPLFGERVIEMMTVTPSASTSPSGAVQVVPGRGVQSIAVDGSGHLIVTLDDDTVVDAGALPSGSGGVSTPDATLSVPGKAVLLGGTATAPTVPWTAVTGKPASLPPSGNAGGVLSGSFPNPGFATPMATSSDLTAGLNGRAAQVHTHTASAVTDFAGSTQSVVASMLLAGTNITLDFNAGTGKLTINSSGGGSGGTNYDGIPSLSNTFESGLT